MSLVLVLLDCLSRTFAGTVSSELLGFCFSFSLFFVSVPCTRLSWPSCQLLSTCIYYIVSYSIWQIDMETEVSEEPGEVIVDKETARASYVVLTAYSAFVYLLTGTGVGEPA